MPFEASCGDTNNSVRLENINKAQP